MVVLFDDGGVACRIAGDRDIRIAQHQRLGQHVVVRCLARTPDPPWRDRTEHGRAGAEKAEGLAPVAPRFSAEIESMIAVFGLRRPSGVSAGQGGLRANVKSATAMTAAA